MGVPGWCFCAGGGKSDRMKANIFSSKGPAMLSVCGGTGFLIHKALLLTTHSNLPSVSAAEGMEIELHSQAVAKLVPHRFFITSSVLDLSVIGFDIMEPGRTTQVQQPHHLRTCPRPCLELGSSIYFLGHTDDKDLVVGEGKVVIATDNLIKFSTSGVTWKPGSAGFDAQGNLAFMVCDPVKLASSPTAKSSSSTSTSSSSSTKKDHWMKFGIPIPVIFQWLNQHWEGSFDGISKPRMPLMRMMSGRQKSDLSNASFSVRRVFKSSEEDNSYNSSSQICFKHTRHISNASFIVSVHKEEIHASHEQSNLTPEIYESPKLTAGPISGDDDPHVQLDINFAPKNPQDIAVSISTEEKRTRASNSGQLITSQHGNHFQELASDRSAVDENPFAQATPNAEAYISHVDNVDDVHSEVQSSSPLELREQPNNVHDIHSEVGSSSPVELSELRNVDDRFHDEYGSESETMYSAETRESRNYTRPKEAKLSQFSRRHSWVNCGQWSNGCQKFGRSHGLTPQKQQSVLLGRKVSAYRSHDYFSPTISSMMKKRNNTELLAKPRDSAQLSPKWIS